MQTPMQPSLLQSLSNEFCSNVWSQHIQHTVLQPYTKLCLLFTDILYSKWFNVIICSWDFQQNGSLTYRKTSLIRI